MCGIYCPGNTNLLYIFVIFSRFWSFSKWGYHILSKFLITACLRVNFANKCHIDFSKHNNVPATDVATNNLGWSSSQMLFAKYLEASPKCMKGNIVLLHGGLLKNEKNDTIDSIKSAPQFVALMTFDVESTRHNF